MVSLVNPARRDGAYRTDERAIGVTGSAITRRGALRTSARAGGFTLVEMLIVVAAIAMLATIAFPTYIAYKIRANRAAAQSFLIDLANREQLHFLDARGYAGNLADLGLDTIPPEVSSYYVIADPVVNNAAAPPVFTLSAVAKAATIQAKDGDLSVNSSGIKSGHW
jgi:type IV pilus assembly protein PilE